jgi:hypothetical protein
MTTSTDDRLLSVSEAAAESGRDRSTLHRAITAGTLTATMIGTQWVIRPRRPAGVHGTAETAAHVTAQPGWSALDSQS